ncbi:hypothetical protein CBR_g41380 [Chara braunii]|uniref:CCHC-type domain-containing protein n=1 Tax=Chara braunii TaxID=69332 RepID=A0A388LVU9_CHABU|nr:hypothetical protein CBR_g41380 [Chara braunii]|eukprot:GBG86385.1 hypothetical protein CBR_g41380 [Chara braunii]
MSTGSDSRENMEGGGSGGLPPDNGRCYKCGEGGHFIRDCMEYWQAKALGRTFVPSTQTNTQTRGRSVTPNMNTMARRSRSAESGGEREIVGDDTNSLMQEYFVQMAEERRFRVERETEEARLRAEEAERRAKENRRLLQQEERLKLEEERESRLLRIIRSEIMQKDREEEKERYERKGKGFARTIGRNDAIEAEKERLRRLIAPEILDTAEEVEDEELRTLRRMAARMNLIEKWKRSPDTPVGNSPPVVTPEKKANTKLTDESKTRIEILKQELGTDPGTTSTPLKIDQSLKHVVSASCGVGGKERFEQNCHGFYDFLTIDELKEACRRENVVYGKRDLAIKRLVIRRSAVAYDPANIPLPSTPRTGARNTRGMTIREVKENVATDFSDSDASYSNEESD